MSKNCCCVCHQPVGPEAKRLGSRVYCERHFAKITQDRPSVWRAGLGLILVQVAFALLFIGLISLLRPTLTGWTLILVGTFLALIPALIWLLFFYQQDRLEPEPKGYVLGVFALGALLAQAVGTPLVESIFDVRSWLPLHPWANFLGSILIIGFTQESLKYAAVRYSIYASAEFDGRVDGVVYGTAAGLGYATVLNLHYVLDGSGINLQAGIIRIVVTAMAQASFAGLTGYFLGRAKFEDEPVWWLPAGVALAATLNGVFTFLRGELTTTALDLTGGGFNPWPGLILAAIVGGATFGVLYVLTRRANQRTLARAETN